MGVLTARIRPASGTRGWQVERDARGVPEGDATAWRSRAVPAVPYGPSNTMVACGCGDIPQDVSRARSSKNGSLKRDEGMSVGFCIAALPCLGLPLAFVFSYFVSSIQVLSLLLSYIWLVS